MMLDWFYEYIYLISPLLGKPSPASKIPLSNFPPNSKTLRKIRPPLQQNMDPLFHIRSRFCQVVSPKKRAIPDPMASFTPLTMDTAKRCVRP